MFRNLRTPRAAAAAALVAGLACAAGTAHAQPAPTPADRHCVVSPAGSPQCFPTFRAALAFATNGAVTDAPAEARGRLAPDLAARVDAAGRQAARANLDARSFGVNALRTVVGVEYEHSVYNGGGGANGRTWIFTWNQLCDDGDTEADVAFGYVGDQANDQISSFEGFSNCWQRGYEHADFGGAVLSLRESDDGLVGDGFDNRISSLQFT